MYQALLLGSIICVFTDLQGAHKPQGEGTGYFWGGGQVLIK